MCSCAHMFSHVWLFCNPMDSSPPGSSVLGILLARILECVATSSSGNLSNLGIKPESPGLAGGFFTTSATWEAQYFHIWSYTMIKQSIDIINIILLYGFGLHCLQRQLSPQGLRYKSNIGIGHLFRKFNQWSKCKPNNSQRGTFWLELFLLFSSIISVSTDL